MDSRVITTTTTVTTETVTTTTESIPVNYMPITPSQERVQNSFTRAMVSRSER